MKPDWNYADTSLPEAEKEVVICILRRAKQVENGDGTTSWVLTNKGAEIDLQADTVFWGEKEAIELSANG